MKSSNPILSLTILLFLSTTSFAQAEWPQWGGLSRDFNAPVKGKGPAESWPANGPKQLWSRPLGNGHSGILVDHGVLYTMYSQGDHEFVIALAAETGKTLWEYKYEAPRASVNYYEQGFGPHSTPLLVGDLLFTAGSLGKVHAFDKKSGKVVWSVDLYKDLGGTEMGRGYSCSPLAYKNTIILTLGGVGQSLVALNQKDGRVVWKNQTLDLSPSSPIIINVDGQEQLVDFMGREVVGLDPSNGELFWRYPHETQWGLNISTPVWGPDNLLFVSSAYNGGSRVLRLSRREGKTTVEELWFHRKLRVHHSNAIRIGDFIYASSGDFGPAFFTCVNVKTGEITFQDRRLPRSNFLYVDGKLIILDEDGNLTLATVSPTGLRVISKASVMKHLSWTVPTLVGTKLYLRDRETITALDLS